MGIYYIDISSHFGIEEITQALQDEENLFSEFKDSRVMTADDLTVVNHVKFEECDKRPTKPIILILQDTQPPSGTEKFWSGTMLISGTIKTVVAYR